MLCYVGRWFRWYDQVESYDEDRLMLKNYLFGVGFILILLCAGSCTFGTIYAFHEGHVWLGCLGLFGFVFGLPAAIALLFEVLQ